MNSQSKKIPRTRARSSKTLRLPGTRIEDFHPLLPAEKKLQLCVAHGEDCLVENYENIRPGKMTKQNEVRASFLRYLILGGCEKSPVAPRGVWLEGAFISCEDPDIGLDLEATIVTHDFSLDRCFIDGDLNVLKMTAKLVSLEGSSVRNLDADGLDISGDLDFSNNFQATGDVSMIGIQVGGEVYLNDGIFENGLDLSNSAVKQNLDMSGKFKAFATVAMRGIKIGGKLICEGGEYLDPNNAIVANRSIIGSDVDLGNVSAKGTIAFTGAEIGGDFMPQGAVLEGIPALQMRNASIKGTLIWRGLGFVDGEVDLSGATCKTLNTGNTSWLRKKPKYRERDPEVDLHERSGAKGKRPNEYHTKLDNFTYGGFSNLPDNCKADYWIEWLRQQPDDHLGKRFKPAPWEQLAGVLEAMGYDEEAREVRIEKQRLQTEFMIHHEPAANDAMNLWHWGTIIFRKFIWGPLVGYGYKPGNALLWLFGLILIGTVVYHQAARQGIMTPTHPLIFKEARPGGSMPGHCAENWVYFPDESCTKAMPTEYSEFQSFIYSADVALPVVNLRMEIDWAPRVVTVDGKRDWFGWWVRSFEWLLIVSGWILSLLFVSAVGSSLRR